MKKTAIIIVAVIMSVFCSIPVYAAANDLPEERTIGVFAKAIYTLPNGCYGAEADDDGNYVVKLPDATKITLISKSIDPYLRIVIAPITKQDKQAYRWVSNRTADFGTDPLFYDIYFIDEYGNRVDAYITFEVSITLMNDCGTLKVGEISADGNVSQLASKSGGNTMTFTIEKGGYYVIASARSGNIGKPISPKTGDNNMTNLCVALLIFSGIGIAGGIGYGKKKDYPAK